MSEYILKYIIIGDSSVGKSCLLIRFTDDKFNPEHEMTVGVEYGTKTIQVDGVNIKIQIWDTAGQESFHSVTASYFRGSACCLLVYSIDSRESFNNAKKWLDELRTNSPDCVVMLLGNKSDLGDSLRQVTTEEGQAFAEKEGLTFAETSALNGSNVSEAFYSTARTIYSRIKEGNGNFSHLGVTEIQDAQLQKASESSGGFCC